MLSVFFLGMFYGDCPPSLCGFFQSSICLRFFAEGFSERTLERESGDFEEVFWVQKCPSCVPKTAKNEVLPFLGRFFRSSIFVTARFCGGFWATNSVLCIGRRFCMVLGVRFCMDLFI